MRVSALALATATSAGSSHGCFLAAPSAFGGCAGQRLTIMCACVFAHTPPLWWTILAACSQHDSSVGFSLSSLSLVAHSSSHFTRFLNLTAQYSLYLSCLLTLPSYDFKRAGVLWRGLNARSKLRSRSGRTSSGAMTTHPIPELGNIYKRVAYSHLVSFSLVSFAIARWLVIPLPLQRNLSR